MKIVHEVYGEAQVCGFAKQYLPRAGESPSGGRCDLTIGFLSETLRAASGDEVAGEGEVIHIEGDVDDVIDMLTATLDLLRAATEDEFVFKRAHDGFPRSQQEGLD